MSKEMNVFNIPITNNIDIDSLYILNDKYYQKLGEVWDHETKDFKILYKPLYNCNSKKGSFEAHHLATSTFERWNRKFIKVKELEELPNELKVYLVSNKCIEEISNGNPTLPLNSKPISTNIQIASAKITINIEDIPTSSSSTPTHIGQSDSGYGSRSLIPYFSIHFDIKWKDMILTGRKSATTRILKSKLKSNNNEYEPDLLSLVDEVNNNISKGGVGVVVKCLCGGGENKPCEMFGNILVSKVEVRSVENLSIELANIEQFDTISEFIDCLKSYYPDLTLKDKVHVFHFTLE